jgi:hypothetical protein
MTPYNNFWRPRTAVFSMSQEDVDKKIAEFKVTNGKLWDMITEIKERMPWNKPLMESLQSNIGVKGELSDKQKALVMSIYIDCCVMSDSSIELQKETRKLGYRLMKCRLGQMGAFVYSVMDKTNRYSLSAGQMRGINNVANRMREQLASIPELTDKTFDGWYEILPEIKAIKETMDEEYRSGNNETNQGV